MKYRLNTKAENGLLITDIVIIVAIFVTLVLIIKGVIAFGALTKSLEKRRDMPEYGGFGVVTSKEIRK